MRYWCRAGCYATVYSGFGITPSAYILLPQYTAGGYFISFDAMDGCAKEIIEKTKEAGVKMTPAGSTYPYGKDPHDSNIRIAPSFPTVEELEVATYIFALSVKLVSVNKLLSQKA